MITIREYASTPYNWLTHFSNGVLKTTTTKTYIPAKTHIGSFLLPKCMLASATISSKRTPSVPLNPNEV